MRSSRPRADLVVGYLPTLYPVLSETFVRLEVAELRRRGAQVFVASFGRGDGVGDRADLVLSDPVPRWRLGAAWLGWLTAHPLRTLRFVRRCRLLADEHREMRVRRLPWLASQLRRAGVQVLHAHFAWSSAARAWALSELMRLPWTVTVHARDMYADLRHLPEKLAAADRVITVCDYNRHELESYSMRLPPAVVVCGVHVPNDLPSPPSTRRTVVAVGRLVPKKGFDLLVEAAALLVGRVPGLRVEILGEGPERERLATAIERHGLQDHVRLTGALPHDQVLQAIGGARLFCLPARIAADGDRDSMPVVIKEAMARGRPVVASNLVGIPEMVDESCGWLVEPDSATALAAALDEALGSPATLDHRGLAARERVASRFRLEDEVAKLHQVFLRARDR